MKRDVTVLSGDCRKVMTALKDNSIDAVVCDPPYALNFMGKEWDSFGRTRPYAERGGYGDKGVLPGYGRGGRSKDVARFARGANQEFQYWCEEWAIECFRVVKPGGYILAFGGTRTYHRMVCAIEDAGFEIRDSLHWIYGSGFPKSLNVSKAIAATPEAQTWEGWGTALKPAHEPIVMARKPLSEKTVSANVLKWGTGAINVDACRVEHVNDADRAESEGKNRHADFGSSARNNHIYGDMSQHPPGNYNGSAGRWPPNVILSHSPECVTTDKTRKVVTGTHVGHNRDGSEIGNTIFSPRRKDTNDGGYATQGKETIPIWDCTDDCPAKEMDRQSGTHPSGHSKTTHDATGGASRFFPCFKYNAKAGKKERPVVNGLPGHPTVKPVAVMQWLVRLVTPPGGLVLDPFAGTGTTGEAALAEGMRCVLIEDDPDSLRLIRERLKVRRTVRSRTTRSTASPTTKSLYHTEV